MSVLEETATRVLAAAVPEDVFGKADARGINALYRMLAHAVHPDRHTGGGKELAERAMRRLTELKAEADRKLAAGTYGDRKPAAPPPRAAEPLDLDIRIGGRHYQVEAPLATGDVADLYRAVDARGRIVVLKVAGTPRDNDLLETEHHALSVLYASPHRPDHKNFLRYFPEPLDSFTLRGRALRRVNVLSWFPGYVSLADILRAYPHGIDFRDAAWMMKRLLVALGYAHRQALVHGAVLPPHVLVHPLEHGAVLVDWCYSVGGPTLRVKAFVPKYKSFYPTEVFEKRVPAPATDLFLFARTAAALLGQEPGGRWPDRVPGPLVSFLSGCLLPAMNRRPSDAWELHSELDRLLERLVGKPSYRRFDMPAWSRDA